MPNDNEEQINEQEAAELEKQRNIENNANLASTAIVGAAAVYGGKAGQTIASKAVDSKLGQKVTHKLGEKIEKANEKNPLGGIVQSATNQASESGALDAARSAVSGIQGSAQGGVKGFSPNGNNFNSQRRLNTNSTGYQANKNFSPKNLAGINKSDLNSANSQINDRLGQNEFKLKSLFKVKDKNVNKPVKLLKGQGKLKIKLLLVLSPAIFLFALIVIFMLLLTKEDAASDQTNYKSNSSQNGYSGGTNPMPIEDVAVIESMLLYIGDSRTVDLINYLESNTVSSIAKNGADYNWYINEAKSQIEAILDTGNIRYVIFNLGINDLSDIDNYINAFNGLKSKYPFIECYYMSINPINEDIAQDNGYSVTTNSIENFNLRLSNTYGDNYLDSYSLLDNVVSPDGIHYDKDTSLRIHNIVLSRLKSN